jgi:hypothetical protein
MTPRKAARAAAPDGASDPRRDDQAGGLIGRKVTFAILTPLADAADGLAVYDGAIQIGAVIERHGECFAFDSGGKHVGTFPTRRARSIPADTIARTHPRSPSGVIGAGADKIVVDEGGKP